MANRFSADVEKALGTRLTELGFDAKPVDTDEAERDYGWSLDGADELRYEGELAGAEVLLVVLPLQGAREEVHAQQRAADEELARLREEGRAVTRGVGIAGERGIVHSVLVSHEEGDEASVATAIDKFMQSLWNADTLKAISEDEAAASDGENPHD
jgi:hypothetical protein